MSDGHFNRALLPRSDYQSGLRAGKASERKLALEALETTIDFLFPDKNQEEKARVISLFKEKLQNNENI